MLHFLNGDEWESVLKSDKFEDVSVVTVENLQQIDSKNPLFFKTKQTDAKIPYDGLKWSNSQTENGKVTFRHQPYYKRISVNGLNLYSIRCKAVHQDGIQKDIIHSGGFTYYHYFLAYGKFEMPPPEESPMQRISSGDANKIQEILEMRSVSDAYKMAKKEGISVNLRQCQNQSRNVHTVKKSLKGPRREVTLAELEHLKSLFPDNVDFDTDNGSLNYRIIKSWEKNINMYLRSCPSEDVMENWKGKVDELMSADAEKRNDLVNRLLSEFPNGIVFHNRLFCDTTFNLDGSYATLLLGEVPHFLTKSSKKNRVIMLALMIHSDKKASTHAFFSNYLKNMFHSQHLPNRIPCLILDGEFSLTQYSEALSTPTIRCDFHLLTLLHHTVGKKQADAAKPFLFGKMQDGTWKKGLFGSYDVKEFDVKLDKIKPLVNSSVFDWLEKNKSMIVECSSLRSKLYAGHVLQYSTSNSVENYNGKLKSALPKKMGIEGLSMAIDEFVHLEYTELCKSILQLSDSVEFVDAVQFCSKDTLSKQSSLRDIGIGCEIMMSWKLPRVVVNGLDIRKCEKEEQSASEWVVISSLPDAYFLENSDVVPGSASKYSTVCRNGATLECTSCHQTLPSYFCRHLIATLTSMNDSERDKEMVKIETYVKTVKIRVPTTSGHKLSDRIGMRKSANNGIRKVNKVTDMSVFDIDEDGPPTLYPFETFDDEELCNEQRQEYEEQSFAASQFSLSTVGDPIASSTRVSRYMPENVPNAYEERGETEFEEDLTENTYNSMTLNKEASVDSANSENLSMTASYEVNGSTSRWCSDESSGKNPKRQKLGSGSKENETNSSRKSSRTRKPKLFDGYVLNNPKRGVQVTRPSKGKEWGDKWRKNLYGLDNVSDEEL